MTRISTDKVDPDSTPSASTAAPADAATADGTGAAPPIYDPRVLASLPMVADGSLPGFAAEMRDLFESTGASALTELEAALASANTALVLRRIHTLKSSSAQVGALELSGLSARYERLMRGGQNPSPQWAVELRAAFVRLQQAWRTSPVHLKPETPP